MSLLKITQTTKDGRKKVWKFDQKKAVLTLGQSRKSTMSSLDQNASAFDAVVEKRADGWHFISFDMAQSTPDTRVIDGSVIDLKQSTLTFNIVERTDYLLNSLENVNPQGQLQKKFLIVSRNNKIIKTEIKNQNENFTFSISGLTHTLPFKGTQSWETTEIEGFQFKSKLVNLSETAHLEKMSEGALDHESKKLLYLTLGAMFLFVAIGVFAPKKSTEIVELQLPKASSQIVVKTEFKKPIEKKAGQKSEFKTQPAQPTTQASASGGGGKVSALLKGAVGVRISQLLGKVSATEARTAQVLVTTKGITAGEGPSGRALAAVGAVNSSGRNWSGEVAASGGGTGISTGGVGAGKGTGGLGQGLAAGKTGQGGVGLIEDESEVTGGLDREVIAQYIKSQLGQILYCYERQLSANPELYGKVAVKFTISGTGQVDSQAINQTTLKSAQVEGCILSKVSKWKFPEPKGGTKVVVTYPFLFKSTN